MATIIHSSTCTQTFVIVYDVTQRVSLKSMNMANLGEINESSAQGNMPLSALLSSGFVPQNTLFHHCLKKKKLTTQRTVRFLSLISFAISNVKTNKENKTLGVGE